MRFIIPILLVVIVCMLAFGPAGDQYLAPRSAIAEQDEQIEPVAPTPIKSKLDSRLDALEKKLQRLSEAEASKSKPALQECPTVSYSPSTPYTAISSTVGYSVGSTQSGGSTGSLRVASYSNGGSTGSYSQPRVSYVVQGGSTGSISQSSAYSKSRTVTRSTNHWSFPGSIDTHLSSEHGVSTVGMTEDEMLSTHDRIHRGSGLFGRARGQPLFPLFGRRK